MKRSGWERLLELWQNVFFTDLFVIACLFAGLIVGIKSWQKDKIYFLIFLYIISALLLILLCDVINPVFLNLKGRESSVFTETFNTCFGIIEYTVFYIFFYNTLRSKKTKKVMTLFLIPYTLTISVFLIKEFDNSLSKTEIVYFSDLIISGELLFLNGLCIVYYYELLKMNPVANLLKSPSFWIVTGLFFYCLLIASFFIISENFIKEYKQIYSGFYALHYISFGLLFLAITKAFLCKKTLTS